MRPIEFVRLSPILALEFLVAAPITPGDELPDKLLAHGREERVLAGIDVLSSSVAQAEKRLGAPTSDQVTFAEQKGIAGERTYVWKKPDVTVIVKTEFIHDAKLKGGTAESPETITVEGSDQEIGKTGRGLKLGDSFSRIGRIYGPRFVKKGNSVEIQWKAGTDLLVSWDDQGLINRIDLSRPE